jgi:hypothetical protein
VSKATERELKWLDDYDLKGRSPLYKYIRKNFAKLKKRKAGMTDGPSWARLAEWLAMRGQTNSRGEPLSWDAVRKVFTRVSRDIEAEERLRRTGIVAPNKPSRMPVGWQPPVAQTEPTQAPVKSPSHQIRPAQNEPVPFAPTGSNTGSADPSRMTPAERLADLRRVIDRRSGR